MLPVIEKVSAKPVCWVLSKLVKISLFDGAAVLYVIRDICGRDERVKDMVDVEVHNHSASLALRLFEHVHRCLEEKESMPFLVAAQTRLPRCLLKKPPTLLPQTLATPPRQRSELAQP
jgi:hypothetical protein